MPHISSSGVEVDRASERFVVLDSWRGLAALLVVVYHSRFSSHVREVALVRNGWLAVDFFFVLSGFVIAHAYGGKLARARDLAAFMIRRTGRLWPLHVFMLLAGVLPWIRGETAAFLAGRPFIDTGENTVYSIVTNLFLVHSLGLHHDLTWNAPSWSISTEFYTYLLFGVAALGCRRFVPAAAAALTLTGVSVILLAHRDMTVSYDYGFFRCVYGFFAGVLVHRALRYVRPSKAARHGSVLEAATALAACAFISYASQSRWAFLAPVVFGSVVLVFALERGLLSRILQRRVFVTLGTLSYSIYMTHAAVYMWLYRAYRFAASRLGIDAVPLPMGSGPFDGNAWVADGLMLATVIVVLLVSSVTYRFVEQPGRRAFNRVAARREVPAPELRPELA